MFFLTSRRVINAGKGLGAVGLGLLAAVGFKYVDNELNNPRSAHNAKKLASGLAMTTPSFVCNRHLEEFYVARPEVEKLILAAAERTSFFNASFTVLHGPKCAGRSWTLAKVLKDKPGVCLVPISRESTKYSILTKIYSLANVKLEEEFILVRKSDLATFKHKQTHGQGMRFHPPTIDDVVIAARAVAVENGKRLTFILEVELGGPGNAEFTLNLSRHIAKRLAQVASVIIIVSEPNAPLEFLTEPRTNFLYMNEMTREEASTFLQKSKSSRFSNFTEDEINRILDKIGRKPIELKTICRSIEIDGLTIDEAIEAEMKVARQKLARFPLRKLLVALRASPTGVVKPCQALQDGTINIANIHSVAPYMDNAGNAIVYDFQEGVYKLSSQTDLTALKDMVL